MSASSPDKGFVPAGAARSISARLGDGEPGGEADARTTSVAVLAAGTAAREDSAAALEDAVARWSEKYPRLPVCVIARPGCDAAIALTAATTDCVLAVVAEPVDSRAAAVVASAERRAHCPIVVLHHGAAGTPYAGKGRAG